MTKKTTKSVNRTKGEHLDDEKIKKLIKLAQDKRSPDLIAAELKIAVSTVHYQKSRLAKLGIDIPRLRGGKKSETPPLPGHQNNNSSISKSPSPIPGAGQPNQKNSLLTDPGNVNVEVNTHSPNGGGCRIIINGTPVQVKRGSTVKIEGFTSVEIGDGVFMFKLG